MSIIYDIQESLESDPGLQVKRNWNIKPVVQTGDDASRVAQLYLWTKQFLFIIINYCIIINNNICLYSRHNFFNEGEEITASSRVSM